MYRRKNSTGSVTLERETLHLSDDSGRVALIDTRTIGTGTEPAQLLRYQLSNHLGSAALETDGAGVVISYEEYYPYGSTSGRSGRWAASKRYRYTGKERDEESGFYYHGARYYASWLGRWIATDPINSEWYNLQDGNPTRSKKRQITELAASSYEYCYDNPIRFTDPTGEQPPPEPKGGAAKGQASNGDTKKKEGGWYETPGGQMKFFEGDLFGHDFKGAGIEGKFVGQLFDGVRGLEYRNDGTIVKVKVYNSGDNVINQSQSGAVPPKIVTTLTSPRADTESSSTSKSPADWYGSFGNFNASLGIFATGIELYGSGSFRLGKGRMHFPSFSPKYYPSGWAGGSKAIIKTFDVAKVGKVLGEVSFGLGVAADIKGAFEYYDKPGSPNAVHPGKAFFNTLIGYLGLKWNPIASTLYYGMDAFYPGGWLGNEEHPGFLKDQAEVQKELDKISDAGPNKIRLVPFGPK